MTDEVTDTNFPDALFVGSNYVVVQTTNAYRDVAILDRTHDYAIVGYLPKFAFNAMVELDALNDVMYLITRVRRDAYADGRTAGKFELQKDMKKLLGVK